MTFFAPSHETMFGQFRRCRGLYILGAGASSGLVPFGSKFIREPAISYTLGGSFPVAIPQRVELTLRSRAAFLAMDRNDALSQLFPGRSIRVGTLDMSYEEISLRQPDFFTRQYLKWKLAEPRFICRQSESYLVFRSFYPSVILNYNIDGLASDMCAPFHQIIAAHGTVEPEDGSPEMERFIAAAREFDLPVPTDDILLCIPESCADERQRQRLRHKLSVAMESRPEFVAVIGYSFGRNGNEYDDSDSWDAFCRAFHSHRFSGRIYVVDPKPDELGWQLAENIKSNNVFTIAALWNILAHAFIEASRDYNARKNISYIYEKIREKYGDEAVFP